MRLQPAALHPESEPDRVKRRKCGKGNVGRKLLLKRAKYAGRKCGERRLSRKRLGSGGSGPFEISDLTGCRLLSGRRSAPKASSMSVQEPLDTSSEIATSGLASLASALA